MVFVSQNRIRGGRGRGRGIGEVVFQSATYEKDSGPRSDYQSRTQVAEELRITVGNDKYRDNKQGTGMDNHYGQRYGPTSGHYDPYRNETGQYRRETDMYNSPSHPFRQQECYHGRDFEREAGDRRGIGASTGMGASQNQPAYSSAPRANEPNYVSSTPAISTSTVSQSSASSRPLKSILKKKNDTADKPAGQQSQKPSGLPGMSNYLDDIDDEDKFLYGDDGDNKHGADILAPKTHTSSGLDIKSAAQTWKPSAPSNTVSGIVSEFVSYQRNYSDRQSYTQPQQSVQYSQAASSTSSTVVGGGDIWSMLAKSVQTVQNQQQNVEQQKNIYGIQQQQNIYQAPLAQNVQNPVEPVKQAQPAQASETGHDPTIENILKSIGFDFDMSKRMQEKAKQAAGEVVPTKPPKTEESQFGIDHGASFIGSGMSHEDMRSSLGQQDSRDSERYRRDTASRDKNDRERNQEYDRVNRDSLDRKRDRDYDDDRVDLNEQKRGRSFDDNSNDSHDRYKSSYDMFSSPGRNVNQTLADKDLSPVSDNGSPPPPMFNLPPITIKRKTGLERNRSPGWEQRRSPERTIQMKRDSRSPSYTKSLSSYGRRSNRSRSISRERDIPAKRNSPVITRTVMISQDFRKKFSPNRSKSPMGKKRSLSPVSRRTPDRRSSRSPGRTRNRSPVRMRSPGKRRSKSPGRDKHRSLSPNRGRSPRRSKSPRKRSRSPRRKSRSPRRRSRSPKRRSRSPKRRSRSPRKRSRSPRRRSRSPRGRSGSPRGRSRSPRGRKRSISPRSSSRDRKLRRSRSGERFGSPGRGRRSRSRSRDRGRSKGSLSGESDSDVDGPANKEYFSSPLRLPGRPPRYFNDPPVSQSMPGPPPNFVPPGPPIMFGQGPPPVPMGGPPPFSIPPPFSVPPPAPPQAPIAYQPQLTYVVPTEPPPVMDPSVPPPGSFNNLNLLPNQHVDLPDIPGEEKRRYSDNRYDKGYDDSNKGSSSRTVNLPRSSSRDKRSSSHERRIVIGGKPKSSSKSGSSSDKDSKKPADKERDKAKIMKEKEDFDNKINILQTEFTNLKKLEEELKANTKMTKENDTILEENSKLREEIKKELSKLVKDRKAFESKHSSLLLKETPSKREITVSKKTDTSKKSDDKKDTSTRKSDDRRDSSSKRSEDKKDIGKKSDDKKDISAEKKDVKTDSQFKVEKGKMMQHQFVDNGDHWCKSCNIDFQNILDFVQHLSSYKHKQSLPIDFRPWKEGFQPHEGMIVNKNGIRVPLPGIEFMYPVTAYYCKLCKIFLGDVSCGADHFKCESHYINYQAYCKDNPYHAKKLQEDKDAFYKKKSEEKKEEKRDRDRAKLTSSEVREQERRKKEEIDSKMRDSRKKSDENDRKDKRSNESEKRNDKSDKGKTDIDKSKATQEISTSQKSGGLPPWQSVSKKVEEPAKSSLDSFLTTDSESGKVPIIVDKKKKVSAQDVLKRFNEKKKLKEIQEREAKEKEYEAQLEKERKEKEALQLQLAVLKNEQALQIQLETSKNQKEIEKLKTELAKEKDKGDKLEVQDMEIDEPEDAKDMQMMGIDPMSATPLFDIVPPPPRTQNIPHPNQKAHSTVSASDVHSVYFTNKSNDTKTTAMSNVGDVANIPLPEFYTVKNISKDIKHEEENPVKKDQTPKKHWKVFYEPATGESANDNSKMKIENASPKKEQNDKGKKNTFEVKSESVKKSTVEAEKPVVHIEIAIDNDSKGENEKQFKVKEEEIGILKIEKYEKENENDDSISQSNECKIEIDMINVTENAENDTTQEMNIVKEIVEETNESNQASAIDEENSEEAETSKEATSQGDDGNQRGKRGGKRGRGRGRGKGRGRGSRGASTAKRSTRATKSVIMSEELDENLSAASFEAQNETSEIENADHEDGAKGSETETLAVESEKVLPVHGNVHSEIKDYKSTDINIVESRDNDPSMVTENDKLKDSLNENISHFDEPKKTIMVVSDVPSDVNSMNIDKGELSVLQIESCTTAEREKLLTSMDEESQSADVSKQQNEGKVKSVNAHVSLDAENADISNDEAMKVKETSERVVAKGSTIKRSAKSKRSSKRSKKQDEIDSKIENDIAEELTGMKVSEKAENEDNNSSEIVDTKGCSESAVDESHFVRRSTRSIRSNVSPVKQDGNLELNSDNQNQLEESTAPEVQSDSQTKEQIEELPVDIGLKDAVDSIEPPKSVTKKTPSKRGRKKTRSNVKSKHITNEKSTDIQPEIDLNLLDTDNNLDSSKYSEMLDIEEGQDSFGIPESSPLQENVNVEINLIGDDNSTVEVNVTNENSSVLNVKNKEKEFDVLLSGVNMVEDNSSSFDFGSPVKPHGTSGGGKDKASDAEDNVSEHSGISMHISSDFEVVDDIDDLADVLPLS